jgi:hypothetical protein
MDTKEIKIEREKLEGNIMNLLNDFETVTGMRVTSIQLDRMSVMDERGDFIYGVELRVEL